MDYRADQALRQRRSLTRNMILVMILVSVTPLLLISAITRHYFQESYIKKVRGCAKLLLAKHQQMIEAFLSERLGAVRTETKSFSLEQLKDEAFLRGRLAVLQQEYGPSFVDLGLVDGHGIQVAYAGPYKLHGADYSKADWFKRAIGKEYYVSDVFSGLRGFPHLVITVREEHQGAGWLLRATIDFETFKTLVETLGPTAGGSAFIVNSEGEFQTKAPSGEELPGQIYADFLAKKSQAAEDVRVVEQADASGKDFVHLMARLNDSAWALVHVQSTDELYADLYAARRSAIAAFLFGVIGIGVGGTLLSKRMVNHIARAAEEKQAINEQLIEAGKLAALGELAAGVAHEINNPVGIMIQEAGWMQDLLEEEDLKRWPTLEEFNRCLNRIQTQGRRCKEITHKLLSFARKTDPTVKTSQLNDLIGEVVALSEQRARFNNVTITMHLEENLPTVNVSPSEVQQVILNIINNSLDALGSKGGTVSITSRLEGDFVVLDMADSGPGIPPANLTRIFEPFFTTKPVGRGTGLGLSICYGIVKKMGGDIKVESDPATGTVFHIYIPLPGYGGSEQ